MNEDYATILDLQKSVEELRMYLMNIKGMWYDADQKADCWQRTAMALARELGKEDYAYAEFLNQGGHQWAGSTISNRID